MAKRSLARTAIEGGRTARCRYDEWIGTRSERSQVRTELRKAAVDPEYAEDVLIEPRWQEYGREFADKLHPILRWLDKQVGRRWDDVYSEICKKFDRRTLFGRHIIDHIISEFGYVNHYRRAPRYFKSYIYDKPYDLAKKWNEQDRKVVGFKWVERDRWAFVIDDDGILRHGLGRKFYR